MSNPVYASDLPRIVRRIRMCEGEAAALVILQHAVENYRPGEEDSGRLLDPSGEEIIEEQLGSSIGQGFFKT